MTHDTVHMQKQCQVLFSSLLNHLIESYTSLHISVQIIFFPHSMFTANKTALHQYARDNATI